MNCFLVDITGPTAVGKTALSIFIAQALQCDILSCDSRQFYREMKIGTSPPSAEELKKVNHHFIGHLSVKDLYSAGQFEKDALETLKTLYTTNNKAIIVGGSGLYESALINGLDDFAETAAEIKGEVASIFGRQGIDGLVSILQEKDPTYLEMVDIKNPRRLMRAVEVCLSTGQKYSTLRRTKQKNRPFKIIKIGLHRDRELLYARINERVDKMMENGLLEEAAQLYPYRHLLPLQTVGYQELFTYLDHAISLPAAVEEIKKNSRRYAKRQMTWYRKDKDIEWFHPDSTTEILDFIQQKIMIL